MSGQRECVGCRCEADVEDLIEVRTARDGSRLYACVACVYGRKSDGLVRFQHDRPGTSRRLESDYGISVEDYELLYVAQRGACAICKAKPTRDRRLAVDHNHKTGEVRGLLCHRCNTALGLFRDKRGIVRRAMEYLSSPPARAALGMTARTNSEFVQAQIAERVLAREEGRKPRSIPRWVR